MDRIVVTGGSNGIGAAVVRAIAARGCRPVTLDRVPPASGAPGTHHPVDLVDADGTAAVLARVRAEGPVTGLVHAAGIVRPARLEDTTPDDLAAVMAVNLQAFVTCAQSLLPDLIACGRGRIVSIASRAALGKEERTAYAASKAALITLTRTWALELAPHGITVNAVAPGPIATELFRRANPDDAPRTRAIVAGVPVGRMGTPEDVAGAVVFFLDPAAGFVTGQTLYVCGGLTVAGVRT